MSEKLPDVPHLAESVASEDTQTDGTTHPGKGMVPTTTFVHYRLFRPAVSPIKDIPADINSFASEANIQHLFRMQLTGLVSV